jgi:hypothetical protein
LAKSKTDIYREGRDVLIAKTGLPTCPVNMLNRYLNLASIENTSQEFIFSSLYLSESENVYKLQRSRQLSYTRSRENLLSALEGNGLDKKTFGLHNLRSGAATATSAAGIDDRLFKKHGRWKSDKAKGGYVKESITDRLLVSKKLGI